MCVPDGDGSGVSGVRFTADGVCVAAWRFCVGVGCKSVSVVGAAPDRCMDMGGYGSRAVSACHPCAQFKGIYHNRGGVDYRMVDNQEFIMRGEIIHCGCKYILRV